MRVEVAVCLFLHHVAHISLHFGHAYVAFLCMTVALAWWFGKTSVSATTTFSLRPAAKTITSAISSGVKGSTPLSFPVRWAGQEGREREKGR